jgi:hypothetical protein
MYLLRFVYPKSEANVDGMNKITYETPRRYYIGSTAGNHGVYSKVAGS